MFQFFFELRGYHFELRQHRDQNGFCLLCHELGKDIQILEFDLFHLRPEGADNRTIPAQQIHFNILAFDATHQVDRPTALLTYAKTGLRVIPGDIAMATRGKDGKINFVTDPQFIPTED